MSKEVYALDTNIVSFSEKNIIMVLIRKVSALYLGNNVVINTHLPYERYEEGF